MLRFAPTVVLGPVDSNKANDCCRQRLKIGITVGLRIRDIALDDTPDTYRYTINTDDHAAPEMEMRLIALRKP